jgi:intron-binding protein aquarius
MESLPGGKLQNFAEAEYAVALYMYHKLAMQSGDPTVSKAIPIILTTEEGQKRLIIELLRQKCGWHPLLGLPEVKTVDEIYSSEIDNSSTVIVSIVWNTLGAPKLL